MSPRRPRCPARESGTDRMHVVEEMQHRRMAFDGEQHVGKTPEHVRADRLALERAGGDAADRPLRSRHAEMVRPERDQPLGEAGARLDRPADAGQRLVAIDDLRRGRRLRRQRRRAGFAGRRHHGRHRRRQMSCLGGCRLDVPQRGRLSRRAALGPLLELPAHRARRGRQVGAVQPNDARLGELRREEPARVAGGDPRVPVAAGAVAESGEGDQPGIALVSHNVFPIVRQHAT